MKKAEIRALFEDFNCCYEEECIEALHRKMVEEVILELDRAIVFGLSKESVDNRIAALRKEIEQ